MTDASHVEEIRERGPKDFYTRLDDPIIGKSEAKKPVDPYSKEFNPRVAAGEDAVPQPKAVTDNTPNLIQKVRMNLAPFIKGRA